MKHSSFFSSKRSALALGLTLGASALFAGVSYAQSLTIPTNMDNAAIWIKSIFLSTSGTPGTPANITLNGAEGSVNIAGRAGTLTVGSSDTTNPGGGGISTTNLTVSNNAVMNNAVIMTALRCDSTVAREKAADEVKKAERALEEAQNQGDEQQIRQAEARLETAQKNLKAIESGENIYCLLMTDAKGNVSITTDITPWLPDDFGDEVFKRNPDNAQDSFFATEDGAASTVNRSNFLRVGITQPSIEATKGDAAMVVGGSIESRGGTFIKKVNGTTSNEGKNLDVKIDTNYTSLENKVENGTVFFESERKNTFGAVQPTNFAFSAIGSTTKVGINTTTPQYTLDVVGNQNVTQSLSIQGRSDFLIAEPVLEAQAIAAPSIDDVVIDPCSLNPRDCIIPIDPCGFRGCDVLDDTPFFHADGKTNVVNIRKNTITRNQNVLNVYGDTTLQGTVKATSYISVGYPSTFAPSSTDKLFVNGSTRANAYYYNSDARYKSNIAHLETPLEKVLSLNGYSYYNKLSEKNDIGVIAQEVEKVFPELVQTDAEGYKSVSYGNLVAPIIEAIKDLFNKYVDQQSQIDALEARIQALEQAK